MAIVKTATKDMIPDIVDLLLDFNNPLISRQDWQNMLRGCCIQEDNGEPGSLALVNRANNDEIVGFIGLITSKRELNGRTRRFCNLTSWIVKRKYRLEALKLLNAALKNQTHSMISFSPSKDVHKLCLKLKFVELEDAYYILSPLTSLTATLSVPCVWTTGNKKRIAAHLKGPDLQILKDHWNTPCSKHLLLYNRQSYCYVISTIRYIRKIPCSWIHYISNPELFFSHESKAKWGLFKTNHTLVTLLDSRLVGTRTLPFAIKRALVPPRLYRPAEEDVTPEMVDSIYSEYMWITPP